MKVHPICGAVGVTEADQPANLTIIVGHGGFAGRATLDGASTALATDSCVITCAGTDYLVPGEADAENVNA